MSVTLITVVFRYFTNMLTCYQTKCKMQGIAASKRSSVMLICMRACSVLTLLDCPSQSTM
jgi:hypothetical protein